MTRFFVLIITNSLGIWLASRLVGGFDFSGSVLELVGTAVVLALLNWIVKPVLKLITGPLVVLTLGLFVVAINGAILWLLDLLVSSLTITTFTALVLATLIMTIINLVAGPIKKK